MHHSVRRTRSRWTTRLRVTSAKLRRPNTTSTTLAWMATSAAWVRGQTVNLPAGYMPSHAKLHTHTRLTALFPGLPGWAGTTEVKPIWILLDQEAVSGSGISWAVCKSAPRSRQITMPVPHHSVFYRPDALPVAQPTASKHWRQSQRKLLSQISVPGWGYAMETLD